MREWPAEGGSFWQPWQHLGTPRPLQLVGPSQHNRRARHPRAWQTPDLGFKGEELGPAISQP